MIRLAGTVLATALLVLALSEAMAQTAATTPQNTTVQSATTTTPLCPYGYPAGTRAFARRRALTNAMAVPSATATPSTTWVCPWGFTSGTGRGAMLGRRMGWRWQASTTQ